MTQPSARAVQELHPRLGRKKFHQVLGGYVLLFFLFSFYGWLLETAHFVIRWGKLTDRGFLSLPLCPIYGFSLLAAGLVLGSPRKGTLRPLFERAKRLRPAARGAAYGGLLLLYYVFASARARNLPSARSATNCSASACGIIRIKGTTCSATSRWTARSYGASCSRSC